LAKLSHSRSVPDLFLRLGSIPACAPGPCACDRKGDDGCGRDVGCEVHRQRDLIWAGPARKDFAPLSLHSAPCRAGRGGTGGDAKGRPKLPADRLRTSWAMIRTKWGMGRGAGRETAKSPASAYPGSNPGPATSATTSADMVTIRAPSRNPAGPGFAPMSLLRTERRHGPSLPRRWAEHALDQPVIGAVSGRHRIWMCCRPDRASAPLIGGRSDAYDRCFTYRRAGTEIGPSSAAAA
jgi:hypothetical protein